MSPILVKTYKFKTVNLNEVIAKSAITVSQNKRFILPFHRNFTYDIDKRSWKYYFLMLALAKGY